VGTTNHNLSSRTLNWLRERGIDEIVYSAVVETLAGEATRYIDFVDGKTTRRLFPLKQLADNQRKDLSKWVTTANRVEH
jgi:hypothetical protein